MEKAAVKKVLYFNCFRKLKQGDYMFMEGEEIRMKN